ncbi:MAG: hypothetical protein ACKV2T_08470 [Kofleriaceae bacterium]
MMRALALVVFVAGGAVANPRVALVDAGFVWHAPDACPDAASVKSRVEQRLGGGLDGTLARIEIEVTRERAGFVARIDARAITVANDVRTLRSRRCDALADAVAVVLARLASEVGLSRNRAPTRIERTADPRAAQAAPSDARLAGAPSFDSTGPIAMAGTTTSVAALSAVEAGDESERDMSTQRIADDEPPPTRVRRWGFGLHVLGLSGVGALPQINLGGELAAFVRRADTFGAIGVSRWVPQDAKLAPGAPGGVEVRLDTLTLRGGWGPSTLPLRAWLLGEVGRLQGTGVGVDGERTAGARWIALGAGIGVGWPMSDHARLVGTFEIAVPLERPRFMLDRGSDLYQPGAAAARCALGLEVGWP